ncbi:15927_t:CDS:2, partial [Dentiscutata heterogama]
KSPSLYNSEAEDINMVNLDLFIQINQGLDYIENYLRGAGTLLNNPINIINGIRDDRDNQIVQLQQDVNFYRQQNANL